MTKSSKSAAALIKNIRESESASLRRVGKAQEYMSEILLISRGNERRISYPSQLISTLCQQGILISHTDGSLTLTAQALTWLARNDSGHCGVDGFRAQHDKIRSIKVPVARKQNCAITVVDSESPLAWLARRKNKSGEHFLSTALVQAGEQLRVDFTRGCMEQHTTMSWHAGRASFSNGARSNGAVNISDNAIDARARVAQAMEAIGPELAGTVMDVCCYLHSITDVEKSRQWPARSGKLILKMGLQALARHYGLLYQVPTSAGHSKSCHLGAEDYRPSL